MTGSEFWRPWVSEERKRSCDFNLFSTVLSSLCCPFLCTSSSLSTSFSLLSSVLSSVYLLSPSPLLTFPPFSFTLTPFQRRRSNIFHPPHSPRCLYTLNLSSLIFLPLPIPSLCLFLAFSFTFFSSPLNTVSLRHAAYLA